MADYRDITTSYSRQFRRPDDARREAEDEQRKADLAAHEPLEPDEMPTAIYNQAFQAELEKYGAEEATEAGGQRVDEAITSVLAEADARVEAASLTPEQRQARAFVDELERRGTVLGDTYVAEADEPASEEETARLSAWLDKDEDTYYMLDEDGQYMTDEAGNYLTVGMHEDEE